MIARLLVTSTYNFVNISVYFISSQLSVIVELKNDFSFLKISCNFIFFLNFNSFLSFICN